MVTDHLKRLFYVLYNYWKRWIKKNPTTILDPESFSLVVIEMSFLFYILSLVIVLELIVQIEILSGDLSSGMILIGAIIVVVPVWLYFKIEGKVESLIESVEEIYADNPSLREYDIPNAELFVFGSVASIALALVLSYFFS